MIDGVTHSTDRKRNGSGYRGIGSVRPAKAADIASAAKL
jgi:hypothetical protein